MQAVILAAGYGKRLRPYTNKVPKPMVPILGQPILEYTLKNLPQQIKEVIIVIGYLGEKIKNYFGNEFEGKSIKYIYQRKQIGTFNALKQAQKYLKKAF